MKCRDVALELGEGCVSIVETGLEVPCGCGQLETSVKVVRGGVGKGVKASQFGGGKGEAQSGGLRYNKGAGDADVDMHVR